MKQIILILIGLSTLVLADYSRDNTTQIVTNTTGLQWQDNSDAKTVTKTWTEAIDYCEALTLGGESDWRLPNVNELYSLADKTKANPAIDNTFQNVVSGKYWSSTTVVGHESFAWDINFDYYSNGSWDNKSDSYHVRCVRSGE